MDIVKAHVVANVADIDVEDLLEDAGNLEEALASRMEGIEAGIEAGLSATESVALDNACNFDAAEQAAAQLSMRKLRRCSMTRIRYLMAKAIILASVMKCVRQAKCLTADG